jgi:hypothetical protein
LKHPGHGKDFFKVSDENIDELVKKQQFNQAEPNHLHTEVEWGHLGKSTGSKPPVKLTPEMHKVILELASVAAKEMFDKYLQSSAAANKGSDSVQEEGSSAPGSEQKLSSKVAAKSRGKSGS